MSVTVRIDDAAHATLSRLARAKRIPLTQAISEAARAYERAEFAAACAAASTPAYRARLAAILEAQETYREKG
jgi:hypothetical protein